MSLTSSLKQENTIRPGVSEGPAGIYVHIPFCRTKCPYCSFVSYPGGDEETKRRYIRALFRQMEQMAGHPWTRSRNFQSLYIGGGNPPTAGPEQVAAFIAAGLAAFDVTAFSDREPEITLEANPNTINSSMLKIFREAGVNRLSIGMQSFSDSMLSRIGRKHSARDNIKAFELAREGGFANINVDLMYGLPGQDAAEWGNCLQQAVSLSPEHLSVYELTIEPGTLFAEEAALGKLNLPPEEAVVEMFEYAREFLGHKGYTQYEISNYAKRGFECRHNINYWKNGSYLGLGAGAVSSYSGVRIKSTESPDQFINRINRGTVPFTEAEFLPLQARFRETVIMGLRLTAGVAIRRLVEQYGMTPQECYGETLKRLLSQDLLAEEEGRLRLTGKGLLLANTVMAQLV